MKDKKFQILELGTFQPLSVEFISETLFDFFQLSLSQKHFLNYFGWVYLRNIFWPILV